MTTTVADSEQTISTLGFVGVFCLLLGGVLAVATASQPLYVVGLALAVVGVLLAVAALTAWVVMLGVKAAKD